MLCRIVIKYYSCCSLMPRWSRFIEIPWWH